MVAGRSHSRGRKRTRSPPTPGSSSKKARSWAGTAMSLSRSPSVRAVGKMALNAGKAYLKKRLSRSRSSSQSTKSFDSQATDQNKFAGAIRKSTYISMVPKFVSHKGIKLHHKMPCVYQFNGAGKYTGSANTNLWVGIDNFNHQGGSSEVARNIQAIARNQIQAAMFPAGLTAGATVVTNVGGQNVGASYTTGGADRVFLTYSTHEYRVVNTTPFISEFVIYDVTVKKTNSINNNIATLVTTPGTEYSNASGASGQIANMHNAPGFEPTDHYNFTQFYNIKKRTCVWLNPGEVYIHKVFIKYKNYISDNIFHPANASAIPLAVKDFDSYALFRVCAAPGVGSGNVNNAGEPAAQMVLEIIARYHFQPASLLSNKFHREVVATTDMNMSGNPETVDEQTGKVWIQGTGDTTAGQL